MMSCRNCLGAIGEPGKVYGYAGAWCMCDKPEPFGVQTPPLNAVDWDEIRRKTSDDLKKQGGLGLAPPKRTEIADCQLPSMTPAEFVVWLRGYFSAYGNNTANMAKGDLSDILAKLNTLGGPK